MHMADHGQHSSYRVTATRAQNNGTTRRNSMNQTQPTSCLIIGAGMAGLTAARVLARRGVVVTVVDKGRGVGGRMATRRLATDHGEARLDHGAQYFTARSDAFRRLVAEWLAEGVGRGMEPRLCHTGRSKARPRRPLPRQQRHERHPQAPGPGARRPHRQRGSEPSGPTTTAGSPSPKTAPLSAPPP